MIARSAQVAVFLALAAAPATAHAVASAELYRTEAYRYGRFEARIRYAPGDGVISSFFLWKVGSEVSGTYWNELDFEKLGPDCRMQTNTLYGNPLNSAEQTHSMPADMCDAYHDYSFEWTPTYIAWFIDAQEIRRETGAIAAAFADNAPDGMRIHFNVWPGNEDFGGNFSPAILPVRQYISWVRYSSYDNGSFNLEWSEDFDGAGVPSGWAVGDWASPLGLSTHNAQNVTFANGIAVLSLTADDATGFTGTPPPDGSGGTAGSGGTSAGGVANAGATSGGASTGGAAGGVGGAGGASTGGAVATTGGATNGGAGVGGSAGATGSAGAANGGAPSSAGASNGGAPQAGATNGGAINTGTGGNTAGSAGSAVSPSGGTSAGGAASGAGAPSTAGLEPTAGNGAPAGDSAGCGCRLAPSSRSLPLETLGLALLAALMGRRRARSSLQRDEIARERE